MRGLGCIVEKREAVFLLGECHWWTIEELRHTNEIIFPLNLIINILESKLTVIVNDAK